MDEREGLLRLQQREVADGLVSCPACGRRLPHHTVSEAWVEAPLADGWVAAYRIVPKQGQPVVAEIRLFPDEPNRDPGCWSNEPTSVPSWGLPGSLLGELRLRDALKKFGDLVEAADSKTGGYISAEVLKRFGLGKTKERATVRPGRRGRDDLFYAIWAAAYVERLQLGDQQPIETLAKDPPLVLEGASPKQMSTNTVRGILFQARRRMLLSEAPRGKAGGELLTKAKSLLSDDRSS